MPQPSNFEHSSTQAIPFEEGDDFIMIDSDSDDDHSVSQLASNTISSKRADAHGARATGFRLPSVERPSSRFTTPILNGSPAQQPTPPSSSRKRRSDVEECDDSASPTSTKRRVKFGDRIVDLPPDRSSHSNSFSGRTGTSARSSAESASQSPRNKQFEGTPGGSFEARPPAARAMRNGTPVEVTQTSAPEDAAALLKALSDLPQQVLAPVKNLAIKCNAQADKLEAQAKEIKAQAEEIKTQAKEIEALRAHVKDTMESFAEQTSKSFANLEEKFQEAIDATDERLAKETPYIPPPPGGAYGGPGVVHGPKPPSIFENMRSNMGRGSGGR